MIPLLGLVNSVDNALYNALFASSEDDEFFTGNDCSSPLWFELNTCQYLNICCGLTRLVAGGYDR